MVWPYGLKCVTVWANVNSFLFPFFFSLPNLPPTPQTRSSYRLQIESSAFARRTKSLPSSRSALHIYLGIDIWVTPPISGYTSDFRACSFSSLRRRSASYSCRQCWRVVYLGSRPFVCLLVVFLFFLPPSLFFPPKLRRLTPHLHPPPPTPQPAHPQQNTLTVCCCVEDAVMQSWCLT